MAKISLLEMGKIKKRNVRETIISILSREFPLSIKKIYNKVKREHSLNVTYQAVFKIIKEMLDDNILEKSEKEYKLNINWIKDLENELEIIKRNYVENNTEKSDKYIQKRVNEFVSELGPKIKKYIGKDYACIIGVSSEGKLFAIGLFKYFLKEGLNVNYTEIDKIKQASEEKLIISRKEIENKKILIVDKAIYSGKTYNMIMNKLARFKKPFNIKDIKYVVDEDMIGLSDFSIKI